MSLFPTLLLCMLLGAAVWHDVRTRRIPNGLVSCGMLAAVALHALPGGLGITAALGGLALGLAFLMPLYVLRMMGAGDVKLLAMVGAFVGAGQIPAVTLATMFAGGVLAVAVAASQRNLGQALANTRAMLVHGSLSALAGMGVKMTPPAAAQGRLPYAVAIAVGTVGWLAWLRLTGELAL